MTINRKVIDIDDYLPFNSTDAIHSFCNRDDGLYKEKKAGLKERLYATGDTSSMSKFIDGIVSAVFEAPLLGTHKWPYKK